MSIKQNVFINSFLFTMFLGISSQTIPSLSIDSKIECYKNQRDGARQLLEYLFIAQPANELKQASSKAQVYMILAGALFMARTSIYDSIYGQNQPKGSFVTTSGNSTKGDNSNAFNLAANLAGLAVSGITYQAYCNYLESNIRKNTMIKFLQNWPKYRSYVPDEFVAAFDELAQYYNDNHNSVTDEQINEMFEIIQHLIEHYFEKRYPKAKDVDLLGTFKTFTDIGKNLKG
ncbi:MAG TPA: hypothetical protein VLG50_08950 [Candidatus Saccharimonadales bacterium]|nr:hypothetical protein [Candidatus Saccharimonadales bacterium]